MGLDSPGLVQCPNCGLGVSGVSDSRGIIDSTFGLTIRRRRTCPHCNTRFTTIEISTQAASEVRSVVGREIIEELKEKYA